MPISRAQTGKEVSKAPGSKKKFTHLREESVMGKNENRLLSAISPLYALSQGKLPGILGVGMSVIEDRKDKKERRENA
jgi:hypothetical protein